jgi:hypothetical protein
VGVEKDQEGVVNNSLSPGAGVGYGPAVQEDGYRFGKTFSPVFFRHSYSLDTGFLNDRFAPMVEKLKITLNKTALKSRSF